MNLVKPSELAGLLTRAEVIEGDEKKWITIATVLAESFCGRPLSITYGKKTIYANSNGVGYIGNNPIVAVASVDTATGLRMRPRAKTFNSGYKTIGPFVDIALPANPADIINRAGRIDLSDYVFGSGINSDYGRNAYGQSSSLLNIGQYEIEVEYYAGFFVDTIATDDADVGTDIVELDSIIGIQANRTNLTFKDDVKPYKVIQLLADNKVKLNKPLEIPIAVGDEVTQLVPRDLKAAIALIIEDRETWEPNADRVSEELGSILQTRVARINKDAIPVDAISILSNYKVRG